MIENKKNLPSMAMFFNICEYLNISPGEFFDYNLNNPKAINEIIIGLRSLDDKVLEHIYGIVKELNRGKK
jgi:transcriptional regulator with XRE-family HTH domain